MRAAKGVRKFTLREQVIDYARKCQNRGFTDADLKYWQPERPESSLRKRRTELAQENIVVETGLTRLNDHGQEEKVWVHRDFHPSPPPVQERDTTPKQSRLARAEALVVDATDIITLCFPIVEEHLDWARASDENPYDNAGMQRLSALTARARKFIEAN